MNIIDTRSNIKPRDYKKDFIKNIPLFETKGIEYSISLNDFTDVIFQSMPSVEFFEEKEQLINKNIYSMGPSTKNFLSQKGFDSICPDIPGSKELIKLLPNNDNNKFLIVKGVDGLNDVFNNLNVNRNYVEEIFCYKRVKFNNYDNLKEPFLDADAVIFSSTYAADIFFKEIYSSDIKAKFFGISNRIINHISNLGYEASFVDYFSEDIAESIKNSI
tara:strand:+ start:6602 stop:7252 length:651 start_codon:yes stop_codon:yes gene_type:complete